MELLEKIKELLPIEIGDKFIGIVYEGKSFSYVCRGYEIRKDGIYLLTSYDMTFKYPEEVRLIGGDTDA